MKDKKHKYLEDLFDEYIQLHDEQAELPGLVEKAQKKFGQYLSTEPNTVYKQSDAEDLYKVHLLLKKHEERRVELNEELAEVEESIKGFLTILKGGKISYERKDDDKSKVTFIFSLEGNQVTCTR
jgi:hypothetical protein